MKKRFYFLLLVLAVILLALLGLGAKAARRLADTTALRSAESTSTSAPLRS
jgi:hypothetical protein